MNAKMLVWLVRVPAGLMTAGLVVSAGCGGDARTAQPLAPDAFARPTVGEDRGGAGNPVDRPGPILYDGDRPVPAPPTSTVPPPVQVGKTVRESVKSPEAEARDEAARLATRYPAISGPSSTTLPTTMTADYWYPIGCVLVEVNGTGIFSDKVIHAIEKPLIAAAKKGNEDRFRRIAAEQFEGQIVGFVREELEFASAQRSLGAEDEQMARAMTVQWRQKKITEAGGSLEMAVRRAAADGWSFDKQAEQQYRLYLVQIYYQKHIYPLVSVQPTDMRNYYDLHKDTEFTTHGQAKFRVIKIDLNDRKISHEEGINLAGDLVKRSATEDFAQLAHSEKQRLDGAVGGSDGFVQKGAFGVRAVEEAAWKLQPGQATVVDNSSDDGCVYVVKLEQLTQDKVEDFDSLEVQDKIRNVLQSQQFAALRDMHTHELMKDAITRRNDQAIQETLASIIDQYPQWAAAK